MAPVEVEFVDSELLERYADSTRRIVIDQQKFFLHGDTTMEIKIRDDEAVVLLDSGLTLTAEAGIVTRAGQPEQASYALQMQLKLRRGSKAQVKFNNRVIATVDFI